MVAEIEISDIEISIKIEYIEDHLSSIVSYTKESL